VSNTDGATSRAVAVWPFPCLASGDAEAAIAEAREEIAVADAGGAWFQAALARAALADALVRTGAPEEDIARAIAEALELVQKSGGHSLLPRLREAEAMYRATGAPDPADRLVKELEGAVG
jgi:hypothetical protein